jgi:hypothetical protein
MSAIHAQRGRFNPKFNIVSNLNWNLTLGPNDISLIGNDFSGPFESSVNETIAEVSGYWDPGTNPYNVQCIRHGRCDWQLDVEKVDINWHNSLNLMLRRTSNNSNVNNGTGWQAVNNVSTPFIDGVGNAYNIQIQYSITGISVLLPADNYSTQVYYTIYSI